MTPADTILSMTEIHKALQHSRDAFEALSDVKSSRQAIKLNLTKLTNQLNRALRHASALSTASDA